MTPSKYASPTYRQTRRKKQAERSRNGNEAKASKRMAEPGDGWTRFDVMLSFAVSPDGRHVSLQMPNGWYRCGSERTIRSVLAKAIWRKTK